MTTDFYAQHIRHWQIVLDHDVDERPSTPSFDTSISSSSTSSAPPSPTSSSTTSSLTLQPPPMLPMLHPVPSLSATPRDALLDRLATNLVPSLAHRSRAAFKPNTSSFRLQCKAPGCTQTFSHRSSRSRHHKRFHSVPSLRH